MKIIKPSYTIIEQKPGLEGIYEQIELAGRTCYKSQRPEGKTAKDFVDMLVKMGHGAMLEHATVYLKIQSPYSYPSDMDFTNLITYNDAVFSGTIRRYQLNPYSKVNFDESEKISAYITTNYRVLVENDWLDDLKYLCEPTEFHEKRVTVHFITSIGVGREFLRHRKFSFANESTRYCNYSSERKFGSEITYIIPSWAISLQEDLLEYFPFDITNSEVHFMNNCYQSEKSYLAMIKEGAKPQEAREVLPLATKSELIMTGFVSDWKHFFSLRTSIIAETGKPHPDASALADPLYKEFIKRNYINE